MDSHYDCAGIRLTIAHENDGMFNWIDNEFALYRSGAHEAPDCRVALVPSLKKGVLPEKAFRISVNGTQTTHMHEGSVFLSDSGYLIGIARDGRSITVYYDAADAGTKNMAKWITKYAVIKLAEKNGVTFVHAAGANYNGKNILFCGDPRHGKSTSLIRMVRRGARVISDDSVLIEGDRFVPFTFNVTIDSDLEKRMGIKAGEFDIREHVEKGMEYRKADVVILLKIWNSAKSEMRPLEYKVALFNLFQMHKREMGGTWPPGTSGDATVHRDVFGRYSRFLEHARCFEFCQGHDDGEVNRVLYEFLDRGCEVRR
jgi:hypothetical protein